MIHCFAGGRPLQWQNNVGRAALRVSRRRPGVGEKHSAVDQGATRQRTGARLRPDQHRRLEEQLDLVGHAVLGQETQLEQSRRRGRPANFQRVGQGVDAEKWRRGRQEKQLF